LTSNNVTSNIDFPNDLMIYFYSQLDIRTAEIFASTELNPYDSLRRQERDSCVSYDIVWRILKNNKFYPYRMSVHQTLNYNDFRQRLAFCN